MITLTNRLYILFLCIFINMFCSAQQTQPNIVLIYVDDMSWGGTSHQMDSSMPNSKMPFLQMPNLDNFITESMAFRNAYSSSPQCAPSRLSLLTGMSTARSGYTVYFGLNRSATTYPEPNNQPLFDTRSQTSAFKVIPNTSDGYIDRHEFTIGEALKELGYNTAHFGKWHLNGNGPGEHGFDEHDGNTNNDTPSLEETINDPKLMFSLTNKSIDYMERMTTSGQPFYLQISHYAGHAPFSCLAETRSKYYNDPNLLDYINNNFDQGKIAARNRASDWLGMIEDLDTTIGSLLQSIDDLNIKEKTYVIFTSDNGLRHFQAEADQALRGNKWWVWEGGIRVPLFVRGPNIPENSSVETNVVQYDFLPTIYDWAGGNSNDLQNIDGRSLKSLMETAQAPNYLQNRSIYFHYPHYRGASSPGSAIVNDNWKSLLFYETPNLDLLFDIYQDVGETNNLARDYPAIFETLSTDLNDYLLSVNARIPVLNPNYTDEGLQEWINADPNNSQEEQNRNLWRWTEGVLSSDFNVFNNQNIKIYPNPFSNQLKINLTDNNFHFYRVQVFNMNGTLIHEESIENDNSDLQLNFNEYTKASGLFFIRVIGDHNVKTYKALRI